MDAASIRLRLQGHGDLTAHRDGTYTLRLERPAGEHWTGRMAREVTDQVPGAAIRLTRRYLSTWKAREVHEVVFGFSAAGESAARLVGHGTRVGA